MNISHVGNIHTNEDRLDYIFAKQFQLIEKYEAIEARSGLLQTSDIPVNLDDRRGQARIKDFAWRVTEEIAEASDAYLQDDMVHFKEELIDALHFLVELTILSGTTTDDLTAPLSGFEGDKLDKICNASEPWGSISENIATVVLHLGMMCNCLKNKPWKQSMMLTDKAAFNRKLSDTWMAFFDLLTIHMDAEEIFQTYFKKSEVNKFRQRSNY